MTLAVAIQCESDVLFRNVRPLETMKEELDASEVQYVHVPPSEKKMGSWEIVLVFRNEESLEKYKQGELKAPWDVVEKAPAKKINPLKASKRAAGKR